MNNRRSLIFDLSLLPLIAADVVLGFAYAVLPPTATLPRLALSLAQLILIALTMLIAVISFLREF